LSPQANQNVRRSLLTAVKRDMVPQLERTEGIRGASLLPKEGLKEIDDFYRPEAAVEVYMVLRGAKVKEFCGVNAKRNYGLLGF